MPVACRRSISAQSGGAEHVISLPGLLLDPAERRDVVVGAEQDPGLARAGLRARGRSPTRRGGACRARASEPGSARCRRASRAAAPGSASPSISRKMIPGTSVAPPSLPPRDPRIDPQRVRVVVVRPERPRRARRTTAEITSAARSAQPNESTSIALRVDLGREQQRSRVEDEEQHEAERQHERQPQRGDDRRQDGVQDGDQQGRQDRVAEAVDAHARARSRPRRARAAAATSQERSSCSGRKRGSSGSQLAVLPYREPRAASMAVDLIRLTCRRRHPDRGMSLGAGLRWSRDW